MNKSSQDNYYLSTEGDDFFSRNYEGKIQTGLRKNKKPILDFIVDSKIKFDSVLEFGCCYADLLSELKTIGMAKEVVGVEASQKAVKTAEELYAKNGVKVFHGTIADNEVMNPENAGKFDLIIIDDVFGWVSRETVFHSVANIDYLLKDGGYIFIRDFYPNKRIKNRNHHISDEDVFNFKVNGSHAQMFLSSGTYEIESQKVFMDNIGMSTSYKCNNKFNYRWTDIILKKSLKDYFDEVYKE